MILKILAPIVIFIIAIIQNIFSDQIKKVMWLKFTFIGLLLISLIIGLIILIVDNNNSKEFSKKQENNIISLSENINELNNKLEPFVNLALMKYPAYDIQTALNKLALDIEETKQLAKPPILIATGKEIRRDNDAITLTLQFSPSKNESLGIIEFYAEVGTNSISKIIDFWPSTKGGGFSSGKDSKKISPDGKSARLIYSLISSGKPTFELRVSKPTNVIITGNYLPEPINLEIK